MSKSIVGHIEDLVNDFKPIGLSDIQSSNLQDRIDTKYLVNASDVPKIIEHLQGHYRCLEVESVRFSRYSSLYFDTPNNSMYYMHQRGFANRHKLRIRNYVDSGIFFLEVKNKKKGRTVKTRIPIENFEETLSPQSKNFYQNQVVHPFEDIEALMYSNYKRLTLVANDDSERITIDLDLEFVKGEKKEFLDDKVLIELKQDRLNRNSRFFKYMKKNQLREMRISKYCIGSALLNPLLKRNKLKRKLKLLTE